MRSLLIPLAAGLLACAGDAPRPAAAPAVEVDLLAKYPPGRWRLLSFADRDRVVLWVSHILIRHEHSALDGAVAFRAAGWHPEGPPPSRSREDARALALEIAELARRDPGEFAALARARSEDVASRERGGSLAGQRASQLGAPFLDALAVTPPGQTTAVIESEHGFHVLKRHPPPAREQLAGQHLLLRYDGEVRELLLGKAARTRAQALELAAELARSERPFSELVARHSEDPDRLRDGDIGVWSTTAPAGHNGVLIETLAGLRVGEVSAPIDTQFGVQLVKRVPVTARETFAVTAIHLRYDAMTADGEPGSRAVVERTAREHVRSIQAQPAQFAQLQAALCCDEPLQWSAGTGSAALEASTAALAIGAIAHEPVDVGGYFLIPRRIAPVPVREPELLYELPAPRTVDLDAYLRHSDGPALAGGVKLLRADARVALSLPEAHRAALDDVLQELERALQAADSAERRLDAKRSAVAALERRLDRASARKVREFAERWLVDAVMKLDL